MHHASKVALGMLLVLGAGPLGAQEQRGGMPVPQEVNENRRDVMKLAPQKTGIELRTMAEDSYRRGLAFLVACQNEDGSFGSFDPKMAELKDFGFGTASRGANDGVLTACTAICAKAFLRKKDRTETEEKAFRDAVDFLLLTDKLAYDMGEAFNTWGYGYELDFLCDFLESAEGKDRKDEIVAAARICVLGLKRFQQADGGWNYYAPPIAGGESMCFNTANFAEALYRAASLGIPVPGGMTEDAAKLVKRMQTIRGGFMYDARFLLSTREVNVLSSAARTAAATEALAEMGIFTEQDLLRGLAIFDEGENWLEDGRKLIVPHTAVDQVSGYFFFYGYHYLAEYLHRLGDRVPVSRHERNAWTMIRTQEKNGCWWDTAAADYGDKWGTGFALMVLQRYFEDCPREGAVAGAE
jgi:hypothetical protein